MARIFNAWLTHELDSGAEKICLSFSKKGDLPWIKAIDTSALKGFEVEKGDKDFSLVLISNSLNSTGERLENKREVIFSHNELSVAQQALTALESAIKQKESKVRKRNISVGLAAGLMLGVALVYAAQFAGISGVTTDISASSGNTYVEQASSGRPADEILVEPNLDEEERGDSQQVTERFAEILTPQDAARFVLDDAINSPSSVKVGKDASSIVMFSDPTCPSCAKMTEQLDEAGMSYTVLPVGLLSDFAMMQSTRILCSVDKVKAYKEALNHIEPELPNNNESFIKGCVDSVDGNNELFMKLQATKIPAIIRTKDAEINIGGFPTTDSLRNWIEQ